MASEVVNPAAARQTWLSWPVPAFVFVIPAFLFLTIAGKRNGWTAGATRQITDNAYLHADLTPLSTNVSGVAEKVNVSDDQHVKAGELLIQLKDADFQAQIARGVASACAQEMKTLSSLYLLQKKERG